MGLLFARCNVGAKIEVCISKGLFTSWITKLSLSPLKYAIGH